MEIAESQAHRAVVWVSAHRFPLFVLLALVALVITGVGASMCCFAD